MSNTAKLHGRNGICGVDYCHSKKCVGTATSSDSSFVSDNFIGSTHRSAVSQGSAEAKVELASFRQSHPEFTPENMKQLGFDIFEDEFDQDGNLLINLEKLRKLKNSPGFKMRVDSAKAKLNRNADQKKVYQEHQQRLKEQSIPRSHSWISSTLDKAMLCLWASVGVAVFQFVHNFTDNLPQSLFITVGFMAVTGVSYLIKTQVPG